MADPHSEAAPDSLERLWAGEFGDRYVQRNDNSFDYRKPFWDGVLESLRPRRVLEVGCNVGANLQWLRAEDYPGRIWGVDINLGALQILRRRHSSVEAVYSPARELPFRDHFFDLVFTAGVLIHQPDLTLGDVMSEMVRCSGRFVMCVEYFAEKPTEVSYRGVSGALFKRDYGSLFLDSFPLRLVDTGFLGRDVGWDDVTWWIFEKAKAQH